MVSDAGGKAGYVPATRWNAYNHLRAKGMSKSKAAAIANAGRSKSGRRAMARKGARTRRARR